MIKCCALKIKIILKRPTAANPSIFKQNRAWIVADTPPLNVALKSETATRQPINHTPTSNRNVILFPQKI